MMSAILAARWLRVSVCCLAMMSLYSRDVIWYIRMLVPPLEEERRLFVESRRCLLGGVVGCLLFTLGELVSVGLTINAAATESVFDIVDAVC